MPDDNLEREQEQAAGAEAAAIGGQVSSEPPATDGEPDPSEQPLVEAGQGEAEGFEEAERELVEHAGHGDQHAARRVIADAPRGWDDARAADDGEADELESTELDEDRP
jgi:hypothetical protein